MRPKRKIHFGVCGIGYGHASRSTVIIKELMRRGWDISVSSYADGFRYLERVGVSVHLVPGISYGVLPEGKVSIKMTIYGNVFLPIKFLSQVSCELSCIEGSDLVLSDSRASTILAGKIAGKKVLTILNQFNIRVDYPRHPKLIELLESMSQVVGQIWGLSDKILVADYPQPYTISKQNLVIPDSLAEKTDFIGPIIEKKPEDLLPKDVLLEKYGLEKNPKPVIYYQASGPKYERAFLTRRILPLLESLSNDFQFIATLGGDEIEGSSKSVKVFQWVEEPLELTKIADVVICRAGQTTLAKALAYGKPVLMIPIPAHGEQLGNARSVSENGAGVILSQSSLSRESLRKSLRELLSNESYRESAEKFSNLFRSLDPVRRVIRELESSW